MVFAIPTEDVPGGHLEILPLDLAPVADVRRHDERHGPLDPVMTCLTNLHPTQPSQHSLPVRPLAPGAGSPTEHPSPEDGLHVVPFGHFTQVKQARMAELASWGQTRSPSADLRFQHSVLCLHIVIKSSPLSRLFGRVEDQQRPISTDSRSLG